MRILAMGTILSTTNLCKIFNTGTSSQQVLKNLDLNIVDGDFTVIMGNSGSGKSTLLYSLSGMDKPTSGSITFAGEKIEEYNNDKLAVFRRKNCGFVFQDILLNESLSIIDNILVSGFLLKKNKNDIIAEAKRLLSDVGIGEDMHQKFPSQMSGGELQRVGFVRAIINNPTIIFADEPTGALNSSNSKIILNLFNTYNEKGKTIVMVTHDLKTAVRGNRILYLKDGVILNEVSLGQYSEDAELSRLDKTKAFLSEMDW